VNVSKEHYQEDIMELHSKIPFSFEDEDYEIRVYYDDSLISVIAFKDNRPINGFRHQIKLAKRESPVGFLNRPVIGELVEMAKTDITERRWARLKGIST
jgi:hypothetical protein